MTGRGAVKLKMESKGFVNTLVLYDLAQVHDLGVKLVSTGHIESQGLKIVSENGMSQLFSFQDLI